MPGWIRVFVFAAGTKSAVLCLVWVLDLAFLDYDTSSLLRVHCSGAPFPLASSAYKVDRKESLLVWDTQHLVHIAKCGYQYEHQFAFYPMIPGLLSLARTPVGFEEWALSYGLFLSFCAGVLSVVVFHRLSTAVLQQPRLAALATILFVLQPATVFHTALYTESLFTLLHFCSLYSLYCCQNLLPATLFVGLSSAVRSNGVVNCGYLLHFCLVRYFESPHLDQGVMWLLKGALATAAGAAPSLLFQAYGYTTFCSNPAQNDTRPWCQSTLPTIYTFVQKTYWGLGFLNYWTLQQLPNFLLAAPMLALSACGCLMYVRHNLHLFMLGGLVAPRSRGGIRQVGFLGPSVCVFIYPWAFMTITAALYMHVQVVTRFVSSCPALHWYLADLWVRKQPRALWLYCFTYCLLGCLLFPNFYPWT